MSKLLSKTQYRPRSPAARPRPPLQYLIDELAADPRHPQRLYDRWRDLWLAEGGSSPDPRGNFRKSLYRARLALRGFSSLTERDADRERARHRHRVGRILFP